MCIWGSLSIHYLICPSCPPFKASRTNSIIFILQIIMSKQRGVLTWGGVRFWTKPRAFFYSLHYLPKSEWIEAVEKEPPHFADGLILRQPSHHIRDGENNSLANTGQRSLVSLRGSDLIIKYFLSTCFVRHVSVMGPFFLQNYTQGTKDTDWNLP